MAGVRQCSMHSGRYVFAFYHAQCVKIRLSFEPCLGTGVLSLPYALKQGGWIGILIIFLAWFMSMTSGNILVQCCYAAGPKRLYSYKEIGDAAFGPIGGWVIFFFNFIILIGASMLFFVLIGGNLHSLLAGTSGELTMALVSIVLRRMNHCGLN